MTRTALTEREGIPVDLRARHRLNADEQARYPHRPERRCIQESGRQGPRHHRADQGVLCQGPARARRHDLHREERIHLIPAPQTGACRTAYSITTTAKEAEIVAQAQRGDDRHEHGRPRRGHHARRQPGVSDQVQISAAPDTNKTISEANFGYAETEDKTILEARALFHEKMAEHDGAEPRGTARRGGSCYILGTERHIRRRYGIKRLRRPKQTTS